MDSDGRLVLLAEEAAQQRRVAIRLLGALCALSGVCAVCATALVTILLL
jgi:hypothetical protein